MDTRARPWGEGRNRRAVGEPARTGEAPGPDIKICGLTRREDACLAAESGADYLGVILVSGTPRAVEVSEGKTILDGLPSKRVAVMANPSLEEAKAWGEALEADILQLHGEEPLSFVRELRRAGPWGIWKALRVRSLADVRRGMAMYGSVTDGLLLDGWHPTQRGGSGTAFSWEEVGEIRGEFLEGLQVIAAGGLKPENVEEAVRWLAPDVVDVSSGVELRLRIKDPEKVTAFIRTVRQAGQGKSG
jgi:phosphoribosylanthranilate isomerase